MRRRAPEDDCRWQDHRTRGQSRVFEQGMRYRQAAIKQTTPWIAVVRRQADVRSIGHALDVRPVTRTCSSVSVSCSSVARLEKVFKEIDETPSGKTCDAIIGIIEEGQEVMKEFKDMPALDAGVLAAAQAVEHYEIARYGTLKTWAGELGLNESVQLLEMTLAEEKKTDEALTKLALSEVNQHAQAA